MNEGACFYTQVGVMDKDCVCQCLSVNYILVSTKVDTKGWMTQLDNMNVYARVRVSVVSVLSVCMCVGVCMPQVRITLYTEFQHCCLRNFKIMLSQDTLSEQWARNQCMLWVQPQEVLFNHWGCPLWGRRLNKYLIIYSSTYPMETHKHMLATHYSTPQASHVHSFIACVLFARHL